MANKDGVARGLTRFNLHGKDLNRDWDRPADPQLAPENHALEVWLEGMIRQGKQPHLALELHNDGNGQLHISRPPVPGLDRHLKRMATLEALLREHTWFTEGSTKAEFRNAGTLGDGWLERYGIDAAVQELNVNWIAGLDDTPTGRALDTLWRAVDTRLFRILRRRPTVIRDRHAGPSPGRTSIIVFHGLIAVAPLKRVASARAFTPGRAGRVALVDKPPVPPGGRKTTRSGAHLSARFTGLLLSSARR